MILRSLKPNVLLVAGCNDAIAILNDNNNRYNSTNKRFQSEYIYLPQRTSNFFVRIFFPFTIIILIILGISRNAEAQSISVNGDTLVTERAINLTGMYYGVDGDSSASSSQMVLHISGRINSTAPTELLDTVSSIRGTHPGKRIILNLSSDGGNFPAALQIAHILWTHGNISTFVASGNSCLSACAIIFLAGNLDSNNRRAQSARIFEHGSTVGLHRPSTFEGGYLRSDGDFVGYEYFIYTDEFERFFPIIRVSQELYFEFMQYEGNNFFYLDGHVAKNNEIVLHR